MITMILPDRGMRSFQNLCKIMLLKNIEKAKHECTKKQRDKVQKKDWDY